MRSLKRATYVMIGGFLGAGKSTAIARLARRLTDSGLRVGLITNDQGAGLVDTSSLRAQGFQVEEIAGGCFCCRFDSLLAAAESLTAATRPDVFLAEPVGSCTDLVATVSYPLRRIYGDQFRVAPLSVLIDPLRALRVLGLDEAARGGRSFSPKVTYIYRKQLEEAELVIINKRDLLDDAQASRLREALASEYPGAEVFEVSARSGDGLDAWFDRLSGAETREERSLEIDYDLYAEGEALLGWLNATVDVAPAGGGLIDGNALLVDLARGLQRRLGARGAEVAHLKMTLLPRAGGRPRARGEPAPAGVGEEIGLVSLVRQDFVPELGQRLAEPIEAGQLVVNLRAEGDPEGLREALLLELESLAARSGVVLALEHADSFRPGRPVPVHRLTASKES
jgi:Ni2+-binding GTPase involved in maturation of urease and hydrogenase